MCYPCGGMSMVMNNTPIVAMLRLWALLGAAAVAGATRILGRSAASPPHSQAASFVRALDFSYSLRVCNAYPFASPLEVLWGEHERLTGKDGPMPYKMCRDFSMPLLKSQRFRSLVVFDGVFFWCLKHINCHPRYR